jgi:hypothetical protein
MCAPFPHFTTGEVLFLLCKDPTYTIIRQCGRIPAYLNRWEILEPIWLHAPLARWTGPRTEYDIRWSRALEYECLPVQRRCYCLRACESATNTALRTYNGLTAHQLVEIRSSRKRGMCQCGKHRHIEQLRITVTKDERQQYLCRHSCTIPTEEACAPRYDSETG